MERESSIIEQISESEEDQIITPWDTKCGKGGFNYTKLIEKFGCEPITVELLERFERVTGYKPHFWMKRGIFFAHRQLSEILDDYEKGQPIYLYTGRGPTSDALHLGHVLSFIFTKWLQDVFNAFVIIQMADDEKYYFKDMEFDKIYRLGFENAKDIIACGFDPDKTFIFSNRDFSGNVSYNKVFCDINKHIHLNQIQAIFGLKSNAPIGQYIWPIYQTTASFSQAFKDIFPKDNPRCLVAYAIDQDPYFRMSRDVAPLLTRYTTPSSEYHKPSSIITRFLPALAGDEKMSSTGISPTIFMTDTSKEVEHKVIKYAYSGGGATLKEHREKGGNLHTDISFQYLRHFEENDQVLDDIADQYSSGKMTSGEIKRIMAKTITQFILKHQEKRNKVTVQDIERFYQMKIYQ